MRHAGFLCSESRSSNEDASANGAPAAEVGADTATCPGSDSTGAEAFAAAGTGATTGTDTDATVAQCREFRSSNEAASAVDAPAADGGAATETCIDACYDFTSKEARAASDAGTTTSTNIDAGAQAAAWACLGNALGRDGDTAGADEQKVDAPHSSRSKSRGSVQTCPGDILRQLVWCENDHQTVGTR